MKKLHVLLLALISLMVTSSKVLASHAAGGEITYEWISGSTYKIIFKFYRDCSGISEPTSQDCCYYNTCTGGVNTVVLNKAPAPNGLEVSTGCPGFSSTCGNGSNPGYREWIYTNTVTLPSQCDFWNFYVSISARNPQDNINGGNLYVETSLNNLAAQGNSSPYFTVKPVPYMCINSPFSFNNGAVDPNGDSLSFEMIRPRTQGGSCTNPANATDIPWTNPSLYNVVNNPLNVNNTFTISPTTGQMSFTPTTQQVATISMLCREWRNGIQIGSIMRDIQVIVLNCVSVAPGLNQDTASLSGINFTNGQVQGCADEPMSFCFDVNSADTGAILKISDNHTISAPNSTVTYTGIGTDSARGCFSWVPTVADSGLHIFTITVKDSACKPPGIVLQQTFTIPLFVWPPVRAYHDTLICSSDTVQLSAAGDTGFVWRALPGGSGDGSLSCLNCKYPKAFPVVTTSYEVTSTGGSSFCNHNKDTVTITILPPPVFDLGPDRTTCVGETITLNANIAPSPGTTYSILWSPATYLSSATSFTPSCTPLATTTYVATVTPNGTAVCSAKDTININVLQGFTIFNNDTAICDGASVQINGIGSSLYSYNWTPAIGVSAPNTINPLITVPDTSRLYTVTASYPGCKDSTHSVYIDMQPNPTVNVGADRILCYGDTVHLSAIVNPASYPNYSYLWAPSGGVSNPNAADPVFTAKATTSLTLNVTTPAGCIGVDDVTFTVVAPKFITLSNDTSICPRDTAVLRVSGKTIASIAWHPDYNINDTLSMTPKVWPVVSTTYTVLARDTNYCLDSGSIVVTVAPEAVINLPDSVRIFPGQSYQMNPGGNALYFSWFPPIGLSATNIADPVAMPPVDTRYYVAAATEFGCVASDSIDVMVTEDSYISMPNAFSPGSQPNAVLHVLHLGDATLKSFTVYNRWGTKLFETKDINEGWDGRYNGVAQPMGVYVYMVEAVAPSGKKYVKQGNVTLIR